MENELSNDLKFETMVLNIDFDDIENHKKIIEEYINNFHHDLEKYGISIDDVKKILEINPSISSEEIINNINENPYKLMGKYNLSFKRCDYIYATSGGKSTANCRNVAAIFETLRLGYVKDFNCYLKRDELIKKSFALLNNSSCFKKLELSDKKNIEILVETLIENKYIDVEKDRIYLHQNFEEQKNLVEFCKLAISSPKENKNVLAYIKKYEKEHNITLGKEQKESIVNSCNSSISIITGGAGVGKTSSLACIISYLIEEEGLKEEDIALAAPTGKAAKRMQESIAGQLHRKFTATTNHMLLVSRYYGKNVTFKFNINNKLNKKVVVIDETSMLNYRMADALVSALKKGTKVIFLGDIEQLEPVGAGFFFRDAIESGIPTVYLKEVHRQKGESSIIHLSQAIRYEKLVEKDIENSNDFSFIQCDKSYDLKAKLNIISQIFMSAVKKSSLDDTMIITPLRETEGNCKIDSKTISLYIQDILLPDKEGEICIEKNGYKLKVGSKIIVTKNNNYKGLINGQIGYIEEIDVESGSIIAIFDGENYELDSKDLNYIRLAYAITVHKSQGSEWKNVIYCCFDDTKMNKKNLVYTAITRAKQNLVIVGDKKTFLRSAVIKSKRKNSVLLNEEECN